ncbi:hypothetical protein PJ985_02335 [Streptomyces sp. ACA25]|uniref:hypothetical protein n=1 Tax=Streptomyces sp. ACA25 TaxID=3022596 RepID=UPI002307570D|nr:hypothetical protein [Streptomyces sp. ACA25]MDB1086413.1 hypothetical protein [Streptomyces sp. ACA25]
MRRHRAVPLRPRPGLAAALAVFLLAGCSAGPDDGMTSEERVLEHQRELAECLEEQGVAVSVEEDGTVSLAPGEDATAEETQEANRLCATLLPPPDNSDELAAERAEALEMGLFFAACMRENGIEDYPDPRPEAPGEGPDRDLLNEFLARPEYRGVEADCELNVRQEYDLG